MKRILYILIICSCFMLHAQPPSKWYNKFGGFGVDIGHDVVQFFDKQYAVIGSTSSFGAGGTDGYLILVDSMGQMKWHKAYGGALSDIGKSIVFNPLDSGFIFTGYSNSFGSGGYDIWIVRTDKNGNLKWQRNYGGIDWDFGNSVTLSSDGSIVVCGTLFDPDSVNKDGIVLKYDMSGTLQWAKKFGGKKDDELNCVVKTADNNLFTVGYTKSFGEINGDNYLLKLDLNGDTIFTKRTGGSGRDFANEIISKADGTYIYTGGSSSYTNMIYVQSYMTCIGPTAGQIWTNNFYASNNTDEAYVAIADNVINPIKTYYLRNVPVPNYKMQGNLFYSPPLGWPDIVNSFGGFEDETFYGMGSTTDGGVACVGSTYSYESHDKDVFLIKLDSNITTYQNLIGIKENATKEASSILYKNLKTLKLIQVNNSDEIETQVAFISITGQKVMEIRSVDKTISINYDGLATGIYLLILQQGAKQKAVKISLD